MHKLTLKTAILLSLSFTTFNSVAAINCTSGSADYPYNANQEPTPEKVKSDGRVYFFSLPKHECQTQTFLINNDKVLKYREVNGFAFVNYINSKGAVVDGWIRNDDIISDADPQQGLVYQDFSWKINGQHIHLLGKATPELNKWVNESGITLSDPENHGFYRGFESRTVTVRNQMITLSQTNNVIEKRLGFNDTYVSGITLVDGQYETVRGIKVGDNWRMVESKYGQEYQSDPEGSCRFYRYFDMTLSFCLDPSDNVQSILFENYPVKP